MTRDENRDFIDGACVTNRPNGMDVLKQKYNAVITKLETRQSWGNFLATYTYAKSLGSVEYTQNAGADFDVYPENFVNRYGYLSDDARHRVKIDGYVRAGATFSGGTVNTALNAFARTGIAARVARQRAGKEPLPAKRIVRTPLGLPHRVPTSKLWAVPLPTVDPQIVGHSSSPSR